MGGTTRSDLLSRQAWWKVQLPSREARYLGPATDPLTYSFPGAHREGKVNQYATLVATNPLDMPTTREHNSVPSGLDPLSDDEDDPYALPPDEEEKEDLTEFSDIDFVRRHSQASDNHIVGPHRQTLDSPGWLLSGLLVQQQGTTCR